jgi:hypothetical protein
MIMTLYKTGPDGSIRYYTIHDRQALFTSRYALTLAYRTGNGQEKESIHGFETRAGMDAMIRKAFRRKIRGGYTLLYSFIRERSPESILGTDCSAGRQPAWTPEAVV